METKYEALNDTQVTVTITVEAAEVDRRIKKTYKDFAHRYNFPGFRKGKAPRPVIDNALGAEHVLATVTDDLMNDFYPRSFDELKIVPTGKPEFGDADLVEQGQDYTFSFTIDIVPDAKLSSFDPVEIQLPAANASEEEIDEQIQMLREHYHKFEIAEEGAAVAMEDRVELDITTTGDTGETIESVTSEDFPYNMGSDTMPAGFDDALMGLKVGDKKTFELELPEEPCVYMYDAGENKKATFEIEVKGISHKVMPELTDEWAADVLGFENLEDLHARIAESIENEKGQYLPRMREILCLQALSERVQAEAPEAMVNDTETRLLQDFFKQLQQQNATLDAYLMQNDMTADEFREDVKLQALDMTKQDMALDSWAQHFGIEAADEDLKEVFKGTGAEDADALYEQWLSSGRMYLIRSSVVRDKALQNIMDTAIVTEIPYGSEASETEAEAAEEAEEAVQTEDAQA